MILDKLDKSKPIQFWISFIFGLAMWFSKHPIMGIIGFHLFLFSWHSVHMQYHVPHPQWFFCFLFFIFWGELKNKEISKKVVKLKVILLSSLIDFIRC